MDMITCQELETIFHINSSEIQGFLLLVKNCMLFLSFAYEDIDVTMVTKKITIAIVTKSLKSTQMCYYMIELSSVMSRKSLIIFKNLT